jgi:carbon monoxide dehydrogenase subunit G
MQINSPKVTLPKSAEEVFNFLSEVKNFEALMPDNISKFEILDEDTYIFALSGMPEIVLKKKEQTPYSTITLGAAGGKLDFSLTANIHAQTDSESHVDLSFSGDFNPMMAMMIKAPITKFVETLARNIPSAI